MDVWSSSYRSLAGALGRQNYPNQRSNQSANQPANQAVNTQPINIQPTNQAKRTCTQASKHTCQLSTYQSSSSGRVFLHSRSVRPFGQLTLRKELWAPYFARSSLRNSFAQRAFLQSALRKVICATYFAQSA